MDSEAVKKSIESVVGKSYADIAFDGRTSRTKFITQFLEKVIEFISLPFFWFREIVGEVDFQY